MGFTSSWDFHKYWALFCNISGVRMSRWRIFAKRKNFKNSKQKNSLDRLRNHHREFRFVTCDRQSRHHWRNRWSYIVDASQLQHLRLIHSWLRCKQLERQQDALIERPSHMRRQRDKWPKKRRRILRVIIPCHKKSTSRGEENSSRNSHSSIKAKQIVGLHSTLELLNLKFDMRGNIFFLRVRLQKRQI